MILSFPNMGPNVYAFKTLFEQLDIEVVLPDPTNREAIKIGVKYSPEFVCFPFKATLGDFVSAIKKGADTLVIAIDYNTFINLDFQKKLQDQGVEVLTIENMPESVFRKPLIVNKRLRNYWRHEEEIMAAIRYYLTKGRGEIDGVIFLISFACGPDSLISELIKLEKRKRKEVCNNHFVQ